MKYPMKMNKTEYLFREIGNIDDRIIAEAMQYRAKSALPRRLLMIAATLVLSVTVLFSALIAALIFTGKPNHREDVPPQSNAPADNPSDAIPTLDAVLSELRGTNRYTELTDETELNFFSGSAQVVWQYADSETLCVSRALEASELTVLTKHIGTGTAVEATTQTATCRVWLLLGDGTVVTPHLKASTGNVGAAELFDYNVELIPSSSFTSLLSGILNS